jgi:aminoglycoside phosphotransferase (APT) family kinase protein
MTTDDRVTTLLSTLFPDATAVSYEIAAGSTLGYTSFVEVCHGNGLAHYILKLAKTDADRQLRLYRTDHTGQAAIDALDVEATLLTTIGSQTTIPVPQVLQANLSPSADESLSPFLLLTQMNGTPLNVMTDVQSDTWRRYLVEIGSHLATLGNAFAFKGFGSLGARNEIVVVTDERATWPCWVDAQYDTYLERLASTPLADLVSVIDTWYDERRDRLPSQPDSVLVHDDVHLGNILVNRTAEDTTITALLDWEEVIAAPREFQVARMEYSLFVAGDMTAKADTRAWGWFWNSYWNESREQRDQEYDERRPIYHLLIWLRMAGNLRFDEDVDETMKADIEQALREDLGEILETHSFP